VGQYDLKRVLLKRWERLIDDLVHGRRPVQAAGEPEPLPVRRAEKSAQPVRRQKRPKRVSRAR
jgi:hypothetical protein